MKAEDLAKLLEAVPAKSLEKFIEIKRELDKVESQRTGLLSQMDRLLGGIAEPKAEPREEPQEKPKAEPVKRRGRQRKSEVAQKPAKVEKPKAKVEAAGIAPQTADTVEPEKRRRGRPRKSAPAKTTVVKDKKARGRKPGKGPRPGSAVAFAVAALKNSGRPMTISEIVDAVSELGFVSNAKNPATSIAQQLYKSPYVTVDSGRFSLPS